MSTCDGGYGIFKSCLTNISAEHSLNTTTKGLLHPAWVWWYLITRSGKWSRKKYSPDSFLCDLCHNIYHKVVLRPDIFSPDYMSNSKVKIWVWARLVKRADLSVSTSQWSSHMSQCLRNNWVTRGRHTLVHYTSQTPLRVSKTPPNVTLAWAWNKLTHSSRLLSLHWTLLIYRATSLRLLQICTRSSPTTKLTWIWLWWCHRYHVTAIKQRMFERGQEVDNPLVSLISADSLFDDDNAMSYWWSVNENSLKCKTENLYENLFTVSRSFMEMKWYYKYTR